MAGKLGGELSLEDQVADGQKKLSLDGQEARGESFQWKTRMLMGRRSCHWMARKLGGKLSLEDQDADGEEICHWVARKMGRSFHWKTRMLMGRRSCHWMARKLGGGEAFTGRPGC